MRKITLRERVQSYTNLTHCLERIATERAKGDLTNEEMLDSFKNQEFLENSLKNAKEQIIILAVKEFS
jgi:hypothetical protein